ncbi:hypothetical protein [Natrarchaeobius chitinivorans]|uniref:Uncharacterized protein n=1 Tax=Natrarchaeobius chitinivorans TaxID=1679083 RepID=A0A3N6P8W8_NATCH|nr:hypothetical protein [Natrarchaeobius chitinivorans]RQG95199.1 hypothetical protein EA473_09650 [Natrarchaeobius chitinivorans]
MGETSSPEFVVDEKIEVAMLLAGVFAVVTAAYYTGRTGNGGPLMGMSVGLLLIVLFVTSE